MTDLILRDIAPALVARVKRLAAMRNSSLEDALMFVIDRGLAGSNPRESVDTFDTRVLEEALVALRKVPNDPGFALIGRAESPPPAPQAPDQSVSMGPR